MGGAEPCGPRTLPCLLGTEATAWRLSASRPLLSLVSPHTPPRPTFRLLVLVVQDYVRGMAQAPCQVDQGAVSKLMDLEDTIIDVGDAIDVILKDIDAEGVT